ncbi:hypothetical protein [Sphingobium lignivorans]|uniref:Uncharacterized protein n=1 Tax=Sphingobium lignivorans TaxID=2735886 RepID=A0ABR6NAA9_9SPHN|nr:hypothetical protein [Sphingobium lignivorans]MBB5984197.1 hypothetical protein [Sphingobium lignivorans]
MDFSFILVIGLSAILASASMIFAEVTSRRVSIFRLPFFAAYLLGLVLMQPWRVTSAEEAGMSAMMLVFMALWVAIGWIIGAIPTALILSIVRWVSATMRRRA